MRFAAQRSVGILQVIVASSLGATMGLEEVVYMIMGMNVGAVAPLVISSLSGNRVTKRAAAAQTAVKLLSAITFSILMLLIPAIVNFVKGLSPSDVSRQVANFHTIYNSVSAVLMFPLIKPVAKMAEKIMPDAPGDELFSRKLLYVTNDLSKSPAIMITQAHAEMMRFADVCRTNLHTALESFFERSEDKAELVIEREKTINYLNHEINSYLVSLYSKGLPDPCSASSGSSRKLCTADRSGKNQGISEYYHRRCQNETGAIGSYSFIRSSRSRQNHTCIHSCQ